jgi:hypothetical protein
MLFLVLKNVRFNDRKKGMMQDLKKGETITLDEITDIDELIMNLAITPADGTLVPEKAWYICRHQFNENFDGKIIRGTAREQIRLSRDEAVRLMAKGYVCPVDEERWFPGKPDHRIEREAKRMYDLDGEAGNQEGWITSWKGKSNENR